MTTCQLIGIHGAPRSGTSWLGQLFNSSERVAYRYQPLFSYAFRDRIDEKSDSNELRQCFDAMLSSGDAFVNQTGSARLARSTPQFEKLPPSHLVYKEVRFHHLIEHFLSTLPEAKFIGIVRDPRAVIASWYRAPREFHSEWSLDAEWRYAPSKNAGLQENWFGFERWKQLTNLFVRLAETYPRRFRILRYEALVSDPERFLGQAFEFCCLPLTEQTRRFIAESTSRDDHDPYGVFRRHDQANGVHLHLPSEIVTEIENELLGTALARFVTSLD